MLRRRAILLSIVLAASAPAAVAQERQVGIRLGPSFTTLVFDPDAGNDYDRRIAAGGGGFAVLPLAGPVALQVEALIHPKGAKLYEPDEDLTGTVLLTYLDIPVLLRVNGPRPASRPWHVFGGPYVGIRTSATRQVSASGGGFTSGVRVNMSDEIERFELGLSGGAGIEVGRRFVVDGRYSWGVTSLNTDRSDGVRIRNRGLSILTGFRF